MQVARHFRNVSLLVVMVMYIPPRSRQNSDREAVEKAAKRNCERSKSDTSHRKLTTLVAIDLAFYHTRRRGLLCLSRLRVMSIQTKELHDNMHRARKRIKVNSLSSLKQPKTTPSMHLHCSPFLACALLTQLLLSSSPLGKSTLHAVCRQHARSMQAVCLHQHQCT